MNLLLLHSHEVDAAGRALLTGRRAQHAHDILKVAANDALRVGIKGGLVGTATVVTSTDQQLELAVVVDAAPPVRPNIDLILAVPRPKALNRLVPALASLGVDRVVFINAARVEKSYFDSKILAPESLAELCELGLEQSKDTMSPTFMIRERFKPFVEDELATWAGPDASRLVLHPEAAVVAGPRPSHERLVLAIGPDGGWVPFEVALLRTAGFTPVSLGARTLRGEVAVPVVIGALRPHYT